MSLMSISEISVSASALCEQIKAGMPLSQAVTRMVDLQPDYRDFWARTSLEVRSGRPLSTSLEEVWPDALVFTVRAGERSGKLHEVFVGIMENVEIQRMTLKKLRTLAYPGFALLGGIAGFIFYMVAVIPSAMSMVDSRHPSIVLQASMWISKTLQSTWLVLVIGAVAGGIYLYGWVRSQEGREQVMEWALSLPLIRDVIRNVYFGLWAKYLALVVSADIPLVQGLELTAPILPSVLRGSVEVFRADIERFNLPVSEAANLNSKQETDPRTQWWPVYIANAFMLGEDTGRFDTLLVAAGGTLIEKGRDAIPVITTTMYYIVVAVSAAMIMVPFLAYYLEMFSALRTIG